MLVDETHLFNINELQLFHYFTCVEGPYPIAYSVDRSQAVGDKGWSTEDIANTLGDSRRGLNDEQGEVVKTVFRSSADIVNLAFAVLSSGATLFTNFDNPMEAAASVFWRVWGQTGEVTKEQALVALDAAAEPWRRSDAEFDDLLFDRQSNLFKLIMVAFEPTPEEFDSLDHGDGEAWYEGPIKRFRDRYDFC